MELMDSSVPRQVTYIMFASDNPDVPTFTTRTVDGQALKRRVESALGKSVESFTTGLTPGEAQELGRILFE